MGKKGLNRTSVGLKLMGVEHMVIHPRGLNRTSVGLKRPLTLEEAERLLRLNRTSVGLKPLLELPPPRGGCASIEPAWD